MGFKFERRKLRLGLRTAKTGLAVFLVLLLFYLLGWEGAQIAALTAVFCLREDWDKSWSFGASRLMGNLIGGGLALVFYWVQAWFGGHVWGSLLILPLLVMLTIVLNVAINNASGVVGATATLLIITLSPVTGPTSWYVIARILQTFVGVFVAILVNVDVQRLKKYLKNQGYVK